VTTSKHARAKQPAVNPDDLIREARIDAELCRHIADTFSAMGDPNRAMILLHLARAEHCVSDLARQVGISESAVSQHLRLLRTLRLVRSRRQGRNIFYQLDDHHVEQLLAVALEHVQGG